MDKENDHNFAFDNFFHKKEKNKEIIINIFNQTINCMHFSCLIDESTLRIPRDLSNTSIQP